jgi:MFS family permease
MVTVLVHIAPFAIDQGISPANAAVILASMNGALTVSSIIIGLITDKIGSRRTFITSYCLLLAIPLFLLPVNSAWLFGLFVVIQSFGAGGVAVMESTLVAELFGMKSHGVILGTIVFVYAAGSALGPLIAGFIFDSTGNYKLAFLLCTILTVIAIIMIILINRMKPVAEKTIR